MKTLTLIEIIYYSKLLRFSLAYSLFIIYRPEARRIRRNITRRDDIYLIFEISSLRVMFQGIPQAEGL